MPTAWQETITNDSKTELETINRLARARIRYFSEALEQEYGLHFKTGAELEFYAYDKNGDIAELGYEKLDSIFKNYERFGSKADHPLVRGSHIEYIYSEDGHKRATEYVIGWKRRDGNPYDAVQEEIERRAPDRIATQLAGLRRMFSRTGAHREHDVESVAFSSQDDPKWTAAQQISLSLVDSHGHNLFTEQGTSSPTPSPLAYATAKGLADVQRETQLLDTATLAANDELINRTQRQIAIIDPAMPDWIFRKHKSSVAIRQNHEHDGGRRRDINDFRIENLLPRAESNPYLAMLQTVAGAYYGLQHYAQFESEQAPRKPENHILRLPNGQMLIVNDQARKESAQLEGYEASHRRFAESRLARSLLGSELHALVEQHYSPQALVKRDEKAAFAASAGR